MRKPRKFIYRWFGWMLPALAYGYIRLTHWAIRWEWIGFEHIEEVIGAGKPVIIAVWHGRLFMLPPLALQLPHEPAAIISNNKDGEMIAKAVSGFGVKAIRGSSHNPGMPQTNKGGSEAFHTALEHLQQGGLLGITPDGPRGPRMRAQHGVATLAARGDVPILPLTYSTRSGKLASSWDRFLIPLPWGRGCFAAGPLIAPPRSASPECIEAKLAEIEEALIAVTQAADAAMGRETPAPQPRLQDDERKGGKPTRALVS